MDGGIQTGQVTEICGTSDSKKSALCHNVLTSFLLHTRNEKAIFISTTSQPIAAKQLLNLEIELCARLEEHEIRIMRHARTYQFRIRDSPKEKPPIAEQISMLQNVFPDLLEREVKAMEDSMNAPITRDESDESYLRVVHSTYSLVLSDIDDCIKAQCRAFLNRLQVLSAFSASDLQNILSELLRFMGIDRETARSKNFPSEAKKKFESAVEELSTSVLDSLTHGTCTPRYIHQKANELGASMNHAELRSFYSTNLIVVDSFYALVAPLLGGGRPQFSPVDNNDSSYREPRSKRRFAGQEVITQIGTMFQALAKQHQVAVVVTNSTVACDTISPSNNTDPSLPQDTPMDDLNSPCQGSKYLPSKIPLVRPALGNTWVQIPDVTILCQRTTDTNHREFRNSEVFQAVEQSSLCGLTLSVYKHSFDMQSRIKAVETDMFLRDYTLITLLSHPTSRHVYNFRPSTVVPTLGVVAVAGDANRMANLTKEATGQVVLPL